MNDEVLYQIHFRLEATGQTKVRRQKLNKEDAESAVKFLNEMYEGRYTHWIEPVKEEEDDDQDV